MKETVYGDTEVALTLNELRDIVIDACAEFAKGKSISIVSKEAVVEAIVVAGGVS